MFLLLKKLIFAITFNSSLFIILMVGIQNSSNKTKVNLLVGESVKLPISFVVGMSFIAGSLTGSFLRIDLNNDWFYNAINLSSVTILEIPLSSNDGVAILNTSVFGTLITFCSLWQDLFAIFKSK